MRGHVENAQSLRLNHPPASPEKLPGHPRPRLLSTNRGLARPTNLQSPLPAASCCRLPRGGPEGPQFTPCYLSPQVRGVLLREAGQHLVRLLQDQPEAQAAAGLQAQAGYRRAPHRRLHALDHARRHLDVSASATATHDRAARSARAAPTREKNDAPPCPSSMASGLLSLFMRHSNSFRTVGFLFEVLY